MVVELNAKNFEEIVNSSVPVLVDVWAEWCPQCLAMNPVVEQISSELSSIKVVKLNAGSESELTQRLGVSTLPAFFIFKNGQVIDQIQGRISARMIQERLEFY